MAANSQSETTTKPRRAWHPILLTALAAGFFLLYWIRPLPTEAITIWPAWIWALPVIALTAAKPKKLWRGMRWPLMAWLALALTFSEIWRIVLPKNVGTTDLKVATLNCATNMLGGMKELAAQKPDIALIQESQWYMDEAKSMRESFGKEYSGVFGHDGSVFVRGDVVFVDQESSDFTFVHARLASGQEVDIVSLRMMAPHARTDYWRKDCWDGYMLHRVKHLQELRGIWARVQKLRTGAPLVLGGDFNLVPDREELAILGPDLVDSFRVAGRGWYATALTEVALFRIDKIWVSKELVPRGTWSNASAISDHRFVLGYFDWAKR